MLAHEDLFARNGAAEVLQDVGFVDFLALDSPGSPLLEKIYEAGGERLREAAEARSDGVPRRRGVRGRVIGTLLDASSSSPASSTSSSRRSWRSRSSWSAHSRTPLGGSKSVSTDYATLGASRFTIPVSVIVAAYNEETVIESSVAVVARLRLSRVRGGRRQRRLHVTRRSTGCARRSSSSRTKCSCATCSRGAGARDLPQPRASQPRRRRQGERGKGRLVERGPECRSLPLRLRRRRGHRVRPAALLKVMRVAVRDPARIVGVTSQITTAREPEASARASGRKAVASTRAYSVSTSIWTSSVPSSTTGWPGHGSASCSARPAASRSGGATCSRRSGATRTEFTCEDIELTFRVHERFLREGRDYRIHCLPDSVGVTEGLDTVAKLVSQRERWQRVISETVVHYRRMWFNPRYGTVGLDRCAVLSRDRGGLASDRDRGPRARLQSRSRSACSISRGSSSCSEPWPSRTRH